MDPTYFDYFKRQYVPSCLATANQSDCSHPGCKKTINGCLTHVLSLSHERFVQLFTEILFAMKSKLTHVTGLNESFWLALGDLDKYLKCPTNCKCQQYNSRCYVHSEIVQSVAKKISQVGTFHSLFLIQDIQTLHFRVPSDIKNITYTSVSSLVHCMRSSYKTEHEDSIYKRNGIAKAIASDFFKDVIFVNIMKPGNLEFELLYAYVADMCINGKPYMSKLVVRPFANGSSWNCIIIEDLTDNNKKYCFELMKNTKKFSETYLKQIGKLSYFTFICYLSLKLTHRMHQTFNVLVKSKETFQNRKNIEAFTRNSFRNGFNLSKGSKLSSTLKLIRKNKKHNRLVDYEKLNSKISSLKMSEVTFSDNWNDATIRQSYENYSNVIDDLSNGLIRSSMTNVILLVENHMHSVGNI